MVLILFILFFTLQSATSCRYKVLFEDPKIFVPCPQFPNNFVTTFLDMKNVNHTLLSNGKIYVAGNITILLNESIKEPAQLSIQFYKKSRGNWVNTIFNVQRSNFCQSLFDPNEIWYSSVNTIKYQKPLCPFREGTVMTVDTISEVIVHIPGKKHEGEYRVDVAIVYGLGQQDFVCARGYWQLVAE